jgi:hypothetical protein
VGEFELVLENEYEDVEEKKDGIGQEPSAYFRIKNVSYTSKKNKKKKKQISLCCTA